MCGNSAQDDDSALFDAMGIPAAMRESLRQDEVIEIWPENWAPFLVFADMQTQWRVGMNGPTGLDYQALDMVMRLHEVNDARECFDAVRMMEIEALNALAEKRGRQ